ncbi:MAG: hypothetical protein KGJ43_08755 [Acidobacteriota bacterium]|nr:hypothetical protein [Acidobacteriota bacterium]
MAVHEVRAELDYATVTVSDPQPPRVVGGVVPAGPQHGTVTVLASGEDSIAGVASLSVVSSSGRVLAGPITAPTGCDYSRVTPCPATLSDLPVALDTTKLPNGLNTIRVEATDAASNVALSTPYTLEVENEVPPPVREEPPATGAESEGATGAAGTPGATAGPTATSSPSSSGAVSAAGNVRGAANGAAPGERHTSGAASGRRARRHGSRRSGRRHLHRRSSARRRRRFRPRARWRGRATHHLA